MGPWFWSPRAGYGPRNQGTVRCAMGTPVIGFNDLGRANRFGRFEVKTR